MPKRQEDVQAAAHDEFAEGEGKEVRVTQLADKLFAAQQATETEVAMSLWQALKLYPKASMWSILISFAVVMEGTSMWSCPVRRAWVMYNADTYRIRHRSRRRFL